MTHDDAAEASAGRTPDQVQADHAAIDRLADELLPALVAKLGASGLGELDVREGAWRVRLRMPGDGRGVRRTAVGGRSLGRAESHASTSGTPGAGVAAQALSPDTGPGLPAEAGPAPGPVIAPDPAALPTRALATSPAVGFFRPRPDLAPGARVRAGDRLGTVDLLGVPQEVVAPVDGLVGASFVEPGDPVEYGQEIIEIETLVVPAAASGGAASGGAASGAAAPDEAVALPAAGPAEPAVARGEAG